MSFIIMTVQHSLPLNLFIIYADKLIELKDNRTSCYHDNNRIYILFIYK